MGLPPQTDHPKPDIDTVHKDIALGNQWRLELDKTLLALVSALFAFTIAFPPSLQSATHEIFLRVGWGALVASMIGGLVEFHGWERFYLTYRDYEFHGKDGRATRRIITLCRRIGRVLFMGGFIIGAAAIGWFAIENLPHVRPPK
jgi:hypothetical protein